MHACMHAHTQKM
jgi:hypothetical protein